MLKNEVALLEGLWQQEIGRDGQVNVERDFGEQAEEFSWRLIAIKAFDLMAKLSSAAFVVEQKKVIAGVIALHIRIVWQVQRAHQAGMHRLALRIGKDFMSENEQAFLIAYFVQEVVPVYGLSLKGFGHVGLYFAVAHKNRKKGKCKGEIFPLHRNRMIMGDDGVIGPAIEWIITPSLNLVF